MRRLKGILLITGKPKAFSPQCIFLFKHSAKSKVSCDAGFPHLHFSVSLLCFQIIDYRHNVTRQLLKEQEKQSHYEDFKQIRNLLLTFHQPTENHSMNNLPAAIGMPMRLYIKARIRFTRILFIVLLDRWILATTSSKLLCTKKKRGGVVLTSQKVLRISPHHHFTFWKLT